MFRVLVVARPAGLLPSVLADRLDVARNTLSFHLKTLANAGLVVTRQEGRFIHCSADFSAMHGLVGFLSENCCGGADCSPAVQPKRKRA